MSNERFYKHISQDKNDGFIPPKDNFFHDNWYVSSHQENFHATNAYGYFARGRGWSMGIKKAIWNISSHGVDVDNGYSRTGKSDE